jgi:transcriptional regulator
MAGAGGLGADGGDRRRSTGRSNREHDMDERMVQLLRGTLHALILRTLVAGPQHGYGIASRIEARAEGAFLLDDGALYQALHRMQERGWLDSEWGHAENGKRARFYKLTPKGRKQLQLETASWFQYVDAVSRILSPAPA